MFNPFRPRGRVLVAGAILAAGSTALVMGIPAGASSGGTTTPANNTLVGSGSGTAYNLMQNMDVLFNGSPGCNPIDASGFTQTLDFSCPPANEAVPPPNVSSSYPNYPDYATSASYTENPANDVSVQEPPLGSSNGIKQLETVTGTSSCASTVPSAPLSYARSSRAPASTDCKGLNFVAYAVDGVSYFYYPEVNGHSTPSAAATNLSQQLLADAWNGILQCWNDPVVAQGSGTPTYTYSTPGCQPIILYAAQSGSGTLATWSTFLGDNPQSYLQTLNGDQFTIQGVNGGAQTETYNSSSHIIFENEDRQLVANGDEANALFFFSYGKYQVTCAKGQCGKIPGATGTTKEALGSINGIAPSKNTILCGAAVGGTNCGPTTDFQPTRFLYNVYSNGTNPNIPAASAATLNYVSEIGFICKPNSQSGKPITDPNSGAPWRSEISKVITGQGFFPLPLQKSENKGADTTAYDMLKADASSGNPYAGEVFSVDGQNQSAANEAGFCLVYTTDGNASS